MFFYLQKIDVSVFETNIRFIGSFLTCYAMTGDPIFRDKAEYVAKKLLPAFQTPTGIPHALINLKNGVSTYNSWKYYLKKIVNGYFLFFFFFY